MTRKLVKRSTFSLFSTEAKRGPSEKHKSRVNATEMRLLRRIEEKTKRIEYKIKFSKSDTIRDRIYPIKDRGGSDEMVWTRVSLSRGYVNKKSV